MKRINDTELLEMLNQGKKQKEIADFFGVSPVAVCKRIRRLLPKPDIGKYNLTDQQKAFVVEKLKGKSNIAAAMTSFDVSSMQSAKSIGSQLMSKPAIQMALNELMECHLPQYHRIRRLRSHVDNRDPLISLKSLDLSWRLDGSYSPEKVMSVNIDHRVLSKEMQELEREIAELETRLSESTEGEEG